MFTAVANGAEVKVNDMGRPPFSVLVTSIREQTPFSMDSEVSLGLWCPQHPTQRSGGRNSSRKRRQQAVGTVWAVRRDARADLNREATVVISTAPSSLLSCHSV